MQQGMKRGLALLLCLVLLGTLLPAPPARAEEIELIPIEEPMEVEPGEEEIVIIGEEPAEPMAGKPTITTQPKSVTAAVGSTAKFTVAASGATSYQWQYRTSSTGAWNNSTATGAKTATLSITAESYRSGYQYRCGVSNSAGTTYTSAATLTVTSVAMPAITTQPKTATAAEGETVNFTVKATGGALTYQWYYRTSSSGEWSKSTGTGYNTATLSVKAVAYREGYQYRCLVKNSAGSVYTNSAALHLLAKPAISTQPKTTTVAEGETASFTVKATGGSLSYQWYYRTSSSGSWAKCTGTGCSTATLSVKAVTYREGYQYRCLVTNSLGSIYSNSAALHLLTKPAITAQPKSVSATEGGTAKFTVMATGGNLSYQWQYRTSSTGSWNNSTASTAKSAAFTVTAESYRSGYQYRCKVSNAAGSVYSNAATLTVEPGKPVIVTEPVSVSVKEGSTVRFTVVAKNAESYQWYWYRESTNSWVAVGTSSGKTATLEYTDVDYGWNGYLFSCKVSNSAGFVWTDNVELAITGRIAPIIKTHPTGAYIKEGETASFTVSARHAESYQWYWYKESEDGWVPISTASAKTATLTYTEVPYSWNEYWFRCKVSNSAGDTWSDSARIRITERTAPVIKTQPENLTTEAGCPAKFTVSAKYADGYQWYWRKNSSSDWNTISTGTYATLSYASVGESWNGYQFRCMVYNSKYSVYSSTVTLTVTPDYVAYRALLVGEVNFNDGSVANRNQGDVQMMSEMLASVSGPTGSKYSVTSKTDLDKAGLKQAIKDAFAGADENDVSLFFLATHGATNIATGSNAGRMVLIGATATEYITFQELADVLKDVPGTIIVFLGSCGSGAAIYDDGGNGVTSLSAEQAAVSEIVFTEAVISAFAEADRQLAAENGRLDPNTGELRASKFYVLTAAAHRENSWGHWNDEEEIDDYNYFTYYIVRGATGSKPADADGNGTITLNELYNYVYDHALEQKPQHAQVYPENSSYALFK